MKYRVDVPDYYSIRLKALLFLESLKAEESNDIIIKIPVRRFSYGCGAEEDNQYHFFHKTEIKYIKTKIERQIEKQFKKEKQPVTFDIAKSMFNRYKNKQLSNQTLNKFNNPKFYEKYVHKYEYRTNV